MQEHELYMLRCLELAELGKGNVSPNPLVGAILVHQNKIIGEAYHQQYGKGHAEYNLIHQVIAKYGEEEAAKLFQQSTLYVSLEPCSHTGKTPPCADLIVKHRIPKVVVGMRDPSQKVNGKGFQKLRDAGIQVEEGLLEHQATWMNRRFYTQIKQQRPHIILKWAETQDGYMAPLQAQKKWITGPEARQLVHQWRAEEDAVLVGFKTAKIDNPQLNVRDYEGRPPLRVVIDKNLDLPETHALLDRSQDTVVFNAHKTDWTPNLKYIALENFDLYLPQQIMYQLYLMDVQSVIIEGGPATLNTFIQADLWDEARVLQASAKWGSGKASPNLPEHAKRMEMFNVGADQFTLWANTAAHFSFLVGE
jgi:diaminohydroxyphosphoribosylaminopyrimidine deaminase/5-amino-6-(5-phosphoribosylamino)uracil reductase